MSEEDVLDDLEGMKREELLRRLFGEYGNWMTTQQLADTLQVVRTATRNIPRQTLPYMKGRPNHYLTIDVVEYILHRLRTGTSHNVQATAKDLRLMAAGRARCERMLACGFDREVLA